MARGAVWMILFKWVERGLGLISTLILVRLLSPADFGVVAMGLSFIFMGELLAAFSFDVALIQNQRATPNHYHSAWTLNVALGAGIAAFMLLLASPIAGFYGRPEVFPVVCVLALGPLLASLENIGVVAFRKDLEFRKEFLFQVSRKVIGFVVTVPLAFWLRSYWALVAGILASKLGGTLVSYWAHPFRPRVSFSEIRSLMNFSRWLLLNNVVGFLKERSSDFVIGRLNGPAALGLYNVSYEFSNLPTNEIGAPINRALLPGYAKLKDDPVQVRITFANVAGVLAVIAIPVGAGMFAVAPFLVPVLLGQKWLGGVPLMEILSLNSALLVFHGNIVTLLIASGHPAAVMRTNAYFVGLLLVGMLLLVPRFGALGAAWSALAACVLSTPIYLYQLRHFVGIPMRRFLEVVIRPVLAAIVMILAVRFALPDYDTAMSTASAGIVLAGGVVLGMLTYGLALIGLWFAGGRPPGGERVLLEQVTSRLAARKAASAG